MKNKFKFIIIALFMLLLTSGCAMRYAQTTRDIRHAGYSVSNADFNCPTLFPDEEVGYERIKYITSSYAITTDGKFYILSLGKEFQNGLNCKRPPNLESKRVKALVDGKLVLCDDNKLYAITGEKAFTEYSFSENDFGLYRALLNDNSIVKAVSVGSQDNTYSFYALKTDGSVYSVIYGKSGNSNNTVYTKLSDVPAYNKTAYGGDIVDFNHLGAAPGTYVRTETEIYRMKAQNAEECSKYADVACKYDMELDNNLTAHMNRMLGFGGNYILTDYGKQFNATN